MYTQNSGIFYVLCGYIIDSMESNEIGYGMRDKR